MWSLHKPIILLIIYRQTDFCVGHARSQDLYCSCRHGGRFVKWLQMLLLLCAPTPGVPLVLPHGLWVSYVTSFGRGDRGKPAYERTYPGGPGVRSTCRVQLFQCDAKRGGLSPHSAAICVPASSHSVGASRSWPACFTIYPPGEGLPSLPGFHLCGFILLFFLELFYFIY